MIPNRYLSRDQYDAFLDYLAATGATEDEVDFEEWATQNYMDDQERG